MLLIIYVLYISAKFYDAINAYGLFRYFINEDIGRMHIFKVQTFRDVIDTIAIAIVVEPFDGNHFVYLPVAW